jgi:hypothetical protein
MSDPVLDDLVGEAVADAATVGLVLHGSRGVGVARVDSDYDVIRVVDDDAYARRRAAGRLFERRLDTGVDMLYQSPGRLAWIAEHPDWYTSTYLNARVVLDRSGAVVSALDAIRSTAHERAAAKLVDYYDRYLVSFSRSLKCWRRGEVLGARLNAADSARFLVRVLFAVAGRWAPYPDHLSRELPQLETTFGWQADALAPALARLVEGGDPAQQQRLERQVTTLLGAHLADYAPDDAVVLARAWDFPPEPAGGVS